MSFLQSMIGAIIDDIEAGSHTGDDFQVLALAIEEPHDAEAWNWVSWAPWEPLSAELRERAKRVLLDNLHNPIPEPAVPWVLSKFTRPEDDDITAPLIAFVRRVGDYDLRWRHDALQQAVCALLSRREGHEAFVPRIRSYVIGESAETLNDWLRMNGA